MTGRTALLSLTVLSAYLVGLVSYTRLHEPGRIVHGMLRKYRRLGCSFGCRYW